MHTTTHTGPPWAPGYRHLTADLPAVEFSARESPEDFLVEELPLVEPLGEGTHVHFTVEKRGLSTTDLVRSVARALGRRPDQIGYAGRKDRHAVTRQRLSVEHAHPREVRALQLGCARVLDARRHPRKLKLGDLAGNRFSLRLRGLPRGQRGTLEAVLERLRRSGMPNYFGAQRFGFRGRAFELGRALLTGDVRGYLCALASEQHARPSPERVQLERLLLSPSPAGRRGAGRLASGLEPHLAALARQLARRAGDPLDLLRAIPRRDLALHVSALQARVFNRVLAQRMDWRGGPGAIKVGDLVCPPWGGEAIPVHDVRRAREVRAGRVGVGALPTGPLPGPAAERTAARVAELEHRVLAEEGLRPEDLRRAPRRAAPRGARRALLVPLRDLALHIEGEQARLSFCLPPGAFATTLLEELLKQHLAAAHR